MKTDPRTRRMRALRRQGMTDAQIAARFGISRERVGQLLGRKVDDGRLVVQERRRDAEIAAAVRRLALCGVSRKEIQRQLGVSYKRVKASTADLDPVLYCSRVLQRARNQKIAELGSRLIALAEGGHPLTVTALSQRLGTAFLSAILRVMTIRQWRQLLGMDRHGRRVDRQAYARFAKLVRSVYGRVEPPTGTTGPAPSPRRRRPNR